MTKFDYLICGAGMFGATFARKATDAGKTCLVIDKNPYVGGMAGDSLIQGQLAGEHGAHIFHTNNEKVWRFINQFGEMIPFINKPKVLSGGRVYSFPINLMTLHQIWGVVTPNEARRKLLEVRIPCEYPENFEEWVLDKIGPELYEKFIYPYTKKQWLKEPRELPISIIQRLPIRLTYDENYFMAKYQAVPKEGYTKLVSNMLDGVKVELGTDFFTMNWEDYAERLVYTGPVDQFFGYEYGELEYNTLRFEHKKFQGDYQGNAVFNHVDLETPYLRSVEHKHFYKKTLKHDTLIVDRDKPTIVTFDYPVPFKEHPVPYYPIQDEKNSKLYAKYKKLLKEDNTNIHVGGRLGSYNYYDLDQTIAQGIKLSERILDSHS